MSEYPDKHKTHIIKGPPKQGWYVYDDDHGCGGGHPINIEFVETCSETLNFHMEVEEAEELANLILDVCMEHRKENGKYK